MKQLLDILSYRRPHLSHSLRECAEAHVLPIGAKADGFGNLVLDVGDAPHILWSAHLDTVHRDAGRQRIFANHRLIMTLPGRKGILPNCLGADDGIGIWLLLEMVKAGINGRYVWHQGEERGGLGSGYIANHPTTLRGIDIAMAFDRRGTRDVITHQMCGRTASTEFAESFARALTTAGLPGYKPAEGIFTDTANYADILPECSNLSCGYANEHRDHESIDVVHVLALRDALCQIDTTGLVVSRKPGEDDKYSYETSEFWEKRYGVVDDGEIVDTPFDENRVWLVDHLVNQAHCLRYDYDTTGKTLCGHYMDDSEGDYWTVGDTWMPEEFCASCMDIETEEYEEWEKISGRHGR